MMKKGKIDLTTGAMQGQLKLILDQNHDLSSEQRYSIMGAIEALSFLSKLAPGLKKAVKEYGNGKKSLRRDYPAVANANGRG